MARAFAAASSQYFVNGAAVVAAHPLTLACWFYPNDVTNSYALMAVDTAAGSSRWGLNSLGATAGDPLAAASVNTAGTQANGLINGVIAATWQHGAAVFASTTSRTAYLNGTAGTTDTTSITVSGIDQTQLGVRTNSSVRAAYLDGRIAEAAVWSVALTASEITTLAGGYCPLFVRPQNLVAYWPLFARATNEESWVGGFTMTNTNTATAAMHPARLIYPARPSLILPASAVSF